MEKRFFIRKYMGDDKYSWAVFDRKTGRPVATGCIRREAQFHADQLNRPAPRGIPTSAGRV